MIVFKDSAGSGSSLFFIASFAGFSIPWNADQLTGLAHTVWHILLPCLSFAEN